MATIQQVPLIIPDAISEALKQGLMTIRGSVVRDLSGQIVTHLDEAPVEAIKATPGLLTQVGAAMKSKPGLYTLVGVGVIAIAAVGVAAAYPNTQDKATPPADPLAVQVNAYNKAFTEYLGELCNGALIESTLDKLLAAIDGVECAAQKLGLALHLDHDRQDALSSLISKHTLELAEVNSFVLTPEQRALITDDATEPMQRLRTNLEIQKQIFRSRAQEADSESA